MSTFPYDVIVLRMLDIGKQIEHYRMKKGISVQQLADGVRVSRQCIYDIESSATKRPSVEIVESIANTLGVTFYQLTGLRK